MKTAERIVIVLILLFIIGGTAWVYVAVQQDRQELRESVARGEFQIPNNVPEEEILPDDWQKIYPVTIPVTIGGVAAQASVADSLTERIKGLSDTPFLPDNVVKLFSFGTLGSHSIWMKDMNYSIDIIWATEDGSIVHIEENVSPDTYPASFESPTPAWYVIETAAGFITNNSIEVGDKLVVAI